MTNINQRLTEVDEILSYMSENDINKIPKEILDCIKNNKDTSYHWKYDNSKKIYNQSIDEDTLAILAYLNINYLLNDEQKDFMNQLYEFNERKSNKNISNDENIEINDLFKNKLTYEKTSENFDDIGNNTNNNTNNYMIEYKESFFSKIINRIIRFFKKNK